MADLEPSTYSPGYRPNSIFSGRGWLLNSIGSFTSRHFGIGSSCGVVRLLIGMLLLTVAILKGFRASTWFTGHAPSDSWWVEAALALVESGLGLWLVSGFLPHLARHLAIATFTLFAGASFAKVLLGEANCGCFGPLAVAPWKTAILDIGCIVLLVAVRPQHREDSGLSLLNVGLSSRSRLYAALPVYGLCGLALFALSASVEYFVAHHDPAVIEPSDWVGRSVAVIPPMETDADLSRGDWLILLIRQGCQRCDDAVASLSRSPALAHNLAAVDVAAEHVRDVSAPSSWARGILKNRAAPFLETPILLTLSQGKVISVRSGSDFLRH